MEKIELKSLNPDELKALLETLSEKPYRAAQLFEWMHSKLAQGLEEMTNIPQKLKIELSKRCVFTKLTVAEQQSSALDGTNKFLFRLEDGNAVESVLMRYHHGNSVCISSQAGCRMGCRFCASTLNGLARNLTPAEMLEEVYQIQRISGERVSNIVVMGSGEPMDNYDNLVRFIQLISHKDGLNISQRNITVSTCGLVENMRRFAKEGFTVTLALSLHAVNDEKRQELMPVARSYPLKEVLAACDYYYENTGRRISYEYSLVSGVNDSEREAATLAELLKGKNCHVNLIPVNPVKERDFRRSDNKSIERFKNMLEKKRINVTIRREMGTDIDAACGQLRKSFMDKVKSEGGETVS